MIAPPANARIWIAAGVTDLRRRFGGLSALVQTALEQDPYGGHVFVFRGRRGDPSKPKNRKQWICFGNTADKAIKLWHSSNMAAATAPDLSALDIDALRAMVLEQHAVIERLQTMIAHLRRMQFGRKSEKIDRQVEQLELELENWNRPRQLGLKSWSASWNRPRQRRLLQLANQFADRCLNICRVKWKPICPPRKVVRLAVRN
jgi:hypothetical protein